MAWRSADCWVLVVRISCGCRASRCSEKVAHEPEMTVSVKWEKTVVESWRAFQAKRRRVVWVLMAVRF
jgi:hypothetical protein